MAEKLGNSPTVFRNFKRQKCRICGCEEKFNFHVPDEIWKKAVPAEHRNQVICLSCFDSFARKENIAYSEEITDLLFAGDKAAVEFEPKSTKDI